MSIDPQQLTELEAFCASAKVMQEGEFAYILLLDLRIHSDGKELVMDALLCPSLHTGYATRLFLQHPVEGKGNNWQPHVILGKTWHVWSWKDVLAEQRLAQIVVGHLAALS